MLTLNNFEEPDTLELLFTMQRKLANAINSNRYPSGTEERISALCTAMIHETIELQRLTNWKWWKNPNEFDTKNAREELIDIWHFLIQASIELNLQPKDILEEYTKKNKINHQRQKDDY